MHNKVNITLFHLTVWRFLAEKEAFQLTFLSVVLGQRV